jgi:hypothetical protein
MNLTTRGVNRCGEREGLLLNQPNVTPLKTGLHKSGIIRERQLSPTGMFHQSSPEAMVKVWTKGRAASSFYLQARQRPTPASSRIGQQVGPLVGPEIRLPRALPHSCSTQVLPKASSKRPQRLP